MLSMPPNNSQLSTAPKLLFLLQCFPPGNERKGRFIEYACAIDGQMLAAIVGGPVYPLLIQSLKIVLRAGGVLFSRGLLIVPFGARRAVAACRR
mmetsp:Transcript_38991/g.117230  ORF Transcript_38991/g.117230 Transcript_38991/m.117230 type:complete len:94 (+) Transcript_38991:506-787(+)